MPGIAEAGWPAAKIHGVEYMTPELVEFGDAWVELFPLMLEHLTSSPTLIHADWRTDNMFIDENGEIVVVNFQLVGVGNGAYDLAYFISQSVEREVRSGRERELVQIYVDMLAANGVDRDFDSVWFDFRVALGFCLAYGFASMAAFEEPPWRWPERRDELATPLRVRHRRPRRCRRGGHADRARQTSEHRTCSRGEEVGSRHPRRL